MRALGQDGGLGDVAGALTSRLRDDDVDVRVLMPAYRSLRAKVDSARRIAALPPITGFPSAVLLQARLPSGVPAMLIDCPALFNRDGGPYQDGSGRGFRDNAKRFAMLSRIAALLARRYQPDRLATRRPALQRLADRSCARARALRARPRARTLMTIHNLAFQGVFDGDLTPLLGLPRETFGIEGVEFYGRTSFLKAG